MLRGIFQLIKKKHSASRFLQSISYVEIAIETLCNEKKTLEVEHYQNDAISVTRGLVQYTRTRVKAVETILQRITL